MVSVEVGCSEPNELIFRKAIDDINIGFENLLFVVNDLDNVKAAIRLAMNGLVLIGDRNVKISEVEVPFIHELRDIFEIVY